MDAGLRHVEAGVAHVNRPDMTGKRITAAEGAARKAKPARAPRPSRCCTGDGEPPVASGDEQAGGQPRVTPGP